MRHKCIITAIFLTFFFILKAHAEQNTIHLICKYSHTIDNEAKSSRTSGETFITVKSRDNGIVIINKQGLGAEFIGKITDEEIYGETEYTVSGAAYQQTLSINRYTGAFEETFTIKGSGGLIHHGNCELLTEKKF